MNPLAWKLFPSWPTVTPARNQARLRGTCDQDFHNDYPFA